MPYSVKILADSVSPDRVRLTTFEATYPRFIHAQVLTHRVFSRNTASSRAIPIEKMIKRVEEDTAYPLVWGSNKPGMQAGAEIDEPAYAKDTWDRARDNAIGQASHLASLGVHKQIVNRLLEPFMFVTTIISATEWDNFFKLRCDDAAQPEIMWLACEMRRLLYAGTPRELVPGEWHRPLVRDDEDLACYDADQLNRISAARCARVSYLTHDGRRDPDADLKLTEKLIASGHWSPLEHVATPTHWSAMMRNYVGWTQYRRSVGG